MLRFSYWQNQRTLTQWSRKRVGGFDAGELFYGEDSGNMQREKQETYTAQISKQICNKINERDISGAVMIASPNATFMPTNPETLEVFRLKHPRRG